MILHNKDRLSTWVINLKQRKDRRRHIENEFKNKKEFDVTIIDVIENEKGTVGLWKSIVLIINRAKKQGNKVYPPYQPHI